MDKALTGMNKVLNIKNISLESSQKCSVIVTIGVRSYLFSTQANGILQVDAVDGAELVKALAKCDARLFLDPVAFNNEVGNLGEAWEEALRERRKMYIEGDEKMYVLLHNALLPHVSSLQAATPTAQVVKQDPGIALDIWKGLEPLQPADKPTPAAPVPSGKGAYTGRRVRLHRLEKVPEMNGNKGTLVEELQDGNWIVRLDGGLGEKILKVDNLMTLSGIQLGTGERCSDSVVLPPADAYVKAA